MPQRTPPNQLVPRPPRDLPRGLKITDPLYKRTDPGYADIPLTILSAWFLRGALYQESHQSKRVAALIKCDAKPDETRKTGIFRRARIAMLMDHAYKCEAKGDRLFHAALARLYSSRYSIQEVGRGTDRPAHLVTVWPKRMKDTHRQTMKFTSSMRWPRNTPPGIRQAWVEAYQDLIPPRPKVKIED